jgi:hypothetical protein
VLIFTTNFEDIQKSVDESLGTFQSHMHRAGAETVERGMYLYKRTVQGWGHDVQFTGTLAFHGAFMTVKIKSDSALYRMIDVTGARPHVIRPRGPWPLRFRTGYIAKTRPGSLWPQARGGTTTGPEVRAMEVHHPGFQPRRFTETIMVELKKEAKEQIQESIGMWAPTVFDPNKTARGFPRRYEWK